MDDDQQFCLRWNNHQSTLVAVFDTLLENEKLVDCTLAAEGKFLNAHKVVLSACSPYFESLLSRHYDKHPILILKDVKFQELKAMMDYMYRGEVNISQDQLGALLKAAESLQIKGLSDNKKDEPVKRPAPAPAPPKSPQPQTQLPKVQGLTIEQRSSRDDREGSMSPGPRKKKRMRRKSEEMDNHHDASNSSDAHSLPSQNIPSATTQLPANVKMNSDVPDTIETKQEILTRHKEEIGSQQSQVPMIKEKLETHTELMLEPKSEYVEEMNEDSIEDLTLDDDDLSNMEQMDDGAGPSHGGEGSSQQGFGHWQMGNQSQDEVFLAAQEAVGAHRDSQGYTRRDQEIAWRRQQYQRRVPQRLAPVYQPKRIDAQLLGARRALNNAVPIKKPSENKPAILKPQAIKPATKETPSILKPPTKTINVEIRKASSIPKASPRTDSGLLTDSLSCIFTRRNNQQRKVPQKRVFYEDVPQNEPPKEKEQELSDTESTYLPEPKPVFVTPQKDCPEPPRISQPTPDISMEDWFATKQRILGNVKHEATQNICEPLKVSESKCPEPPHIEVDPHGFDIEPPAHINKNVSPYVPTNSYERDEYEKYKSEKFKKEIALALLQKHYEKAQEAKKQREEAENAQQQSTVVETHYSQVATYVSTQQEYEEDEDMEKYQVDKETYYEQPSYQPTSLKEQTQQYGDVSPSYQTEYYGRYDTYQENQAPQEHTYPPQDYKNDQKLDENNCPEAPQISSTPQENIPPEPPVISQERDDNPQYYQGYIKYDETNTFKEPIAQPVRASNQTMCHKCSFQTTNPKKLRDHLKFVHGEVVAVENPKPKELFSRREPKVQEAQEELFSRRGDFQSTQETEKKTRFKRRNTSALVNIISSDVVVPARSETENRGEAAYEAGDANAQTQESGVLAAMEYFETTKDQPKKPRPYKRDPDQLDNDWI